VTDKSEKDEMKRWLGTLSSAVVATVLFLTLWPFNPLPANRVSWLGREDGVELGTPGILLSKTFLEAKPDETKGSCSLELLVRPARTEGTYTILSIYVLNNPKQFMLRQWMDGMIVAEGILDTQGRVRTAKVDVDHAFKRGKWRLVTITSGSNGTLVYLDGIRVEAFAKFEISLSQCLGEMVVGTSAVDFEPWPGGIRGLAIYTRELTPAEVFQNTKDWNERPRSILSGLHGAIALYAFSERAGHTVHNAVIGGPDLVVPRNFRVPHKAILQSPMQDYEASWSYVLDLLRNIIGFIPLGFILCAYFSCTPYQRRARLWAILVSGALSLVIELLQAYIPQRASGTTDIITNLVGATLGSLLCKPRALTLLSRKTGDSYDLTSGY
jgi:VanZ family protein